MKYILFDDDKVGNVLEAGDIAKDGDKIDLQCATVCLIELPTGKWLQISISEWGTVELRERPHAKGTSA